MPRSDRKPANRQEAVPCVRLPKFLEAELQAGHPWVYRNHIPDGFEATTGTWVQAVCGNTAAFGLWDNDSQLALRLYSRQGPLDQAQITERVTYAWQLRSKLKSSDTDAVRLINGEGDGLPSIVVDLYGQYAVIATYGAAVVPLTKLLVNALSQVIAPRGIAWRNMTGGDTDAPALTWLHGGPPTSELIISEYGVRLYADLEQGHKTGLYLDQRENRQTFARYASGSTVLNLYAYTGGFSVFAALSGAERVTSVDIAGPALRRARDNFKLNGLDPDEHEFAAADCFQFIKQCQDQGRQFGVIVCDPPSLARNRSQLPDALKAYARINSLGLRLVSDGGYYAASSCTAQVSPEAFRKVLVQAATQAHRRVQIVHEAGQAWDHPVNLAHPEGRYLKFVVLRVTSG